MTKNGMVSVKELQAHYGLHRWSLERNASNRLLGLLVPIAGAELSDSDKAVLANAAWATAGLQRAHAFLIANLGRAEDATNLGVPAAMAFLTGPYSISLDHLLGTSLWMDLSDVLIWYRTVIERLNKMKGLARRNRINVSLGDIEKLASELDAEVLPAISTKAVRKLADAVLHEHWHPDGVGGVDLVLHFDGQAPNVSIDFAPGGFLDSLDALVESTVEQVSDIIERATSAPSTVGTGSTRS